MDELAPATYSNLIYSSSKNINYDRNTDTKNALAAISNTATSFNIASTGANYSLSPWNTSTILNRYNCTTIDYGSDNCSAGAKWGISYGCEYYSTPLSVDHDALCQYIYNQNSPYANFDATIQKRNMIKNKFTIIIKSRAQELCSIPDNEWVAMQTLREMITEAAYRRYIKDGFITVSGQSGKVYQIFRNKCHIKVYFKGELIEEICVRLTGNAPPTDSVVAFKTMIEVDEESFANLGNRYNMKQAA